MIVNRLRVIPVEIVRNLLNRVGYGIHNSYLFAFEQGGTLAFVLFLLWYDYDIKIVYITIIPQNE